LQVTYATTMGQNLDMLTAPDGVDNFDAYNMARYCQIVKFKVCGKNLSGCCWRRRGRTFGGESAGLMRSTHCLWAGSLLSPILDRCRPTTHPHHLPSAWASRRRSTPSTSRRRARCSFAA